MPTLAGFEFWVPEGFRRVGVNEFEGSDSLVRIDLKRNGGFVDFGILGPSDQLWVVGSRVVARVRGPHRSVTLVVADRVWLENDEFGLAQVRCTYVSRDPAFPDEAANKVLEGARMLSRDSFALDESGHLSFGPLPVPGRWFGTGVDTEELLFGGGFLEFGEKAPGAGFDLLLLPSEVDRSPITGALARRSAGMAVTKLKLWGCSAWVGHSDSRLVIVFRDPLGYAWRAEYRRGRLTAKHWSNVLGFVGR